MPRKVLLLVVVLATAALALAGCREGEPGGATGRVTVVEAPVGQTVAVPGEDLNVSFLQVLEDSRCPRDVTCVQAGRARVRVTLANSAGRLGDFELTVEADNRSGNWVQAGDFSVRLAALQPYPEQSMTNTPVPQRQYIAVVEVSRVEG